MANDRSADVLGRLDRMEETKTPTGHSHKDPSGANSHKDPLGGNVLQYPGVPMRDISPVANMGLATTMRQLQERQSAWFLFIMDQMYVGVGGRGKPLPGLEGGVYIL